MQIHTRQIRVLRWVGFLLTFWVLPFALQAGEEETAVKPLTVVILTTDSNIFEGIIDGFENGFLLLRTTDKIVEFSPKHVRALFGNRADAEKAKEDPRWLASTLSHKAEKKPPKKPLPQTKPPKENPKDKPKPPKREKPGPVHPKSELEKAYFAKKPPTDPTKMEEYFRQCARESLKIAKHYSKQGADILQERSESVSRVTLKAIGVPNALLDPDWFRPLLLSMAYTREGAEQMFQTMRRTFQPEKRQALRKKLEDKRKAVWIFAFMHVKTVEKSDAITEKEKQTVRDRLAIVREEFQSPQGPPKRHGGPRKPNRRFEDETP